VSMPEQTAGKLPLRVAIETRDLTALADAFQPDAVLRSPLTDQLTFQGREQIAAVFEVILDVFDGLTYTDELRGDQTAVLVAQATVDGQSIEIVDHMRLSSDGRIRELTVFFRPLPASAVALRRIGSGLAQRTSSGRSTAISVLAAPLALMARAGDRVGVMLVKPTL
jgi:SnoaL-like domain